DLLSDLKTTLVIPLSPAKIAAPMSLSRLNPSFALDGETFFAITQDIAGIDRSQLGAQSYDLSALRSEIVAAVDFVLSGI
ncbi:MAG: CcdB family protein, partial [Thermodesulfovibrionia bacterium]|nr:CcdB family protein [Thermodesulfovibrionia bacterium]